MAVIGTNNFNFDLENIQNKIWFDIATRSLEAQSDRLFEKHQSDQWFDYAVLEGGLKEAFIKRQGEAMRYDDMSQGPQKIYRKSIVQTGYSHTMEAAMFGQRKPALKKGMEEMRKTLFEKKENLLVGLVDNAFTDAIGIDGKEICADDHPIQDGLTTSNEMATSADLSEVSLEQMSLELNEGMKNYRGRRADVKPRFLIVPEELRYEQARILKTVGQVYTPDNTINAVRDAGLLPEEPLIHRRLSDPDAFFMKTDVPQGLLLFQVMEPKFISDQSFDTQSTKFAALEMYGYGPANYNTLFGSPGAA